MQSDVTERNYKRASIYLNFSIRQIDNQILIIPFKNCERVTYCFQTVYSIQCHSKRRIK